MQNNKMDILERINLMDDTITTDEIVILLNSIDVDCKQLIFILQMLHEHVQEYPVGKNVRYIISSNSTASLLSTTVDRSIQALASSGNFIFTGIVDRWTLLDEHRLFAGTIESKHRKIIIVDNATERLKNKDLSSVEQLCLSARAEEAQQIVDRCTSLRTLMCSSASVTSIAAIASKLHRLSAGQEWIVPERDLLLATNLEILTGYIVRSPTSLHTLVNLSNLRRLACSTIMNVGEINLSHLEKLSSISLTGHFRHLVLPPSATRLELVVNHYVDDDALEKFVNLTALTLIDCPCVVDVNAPSTLTELKLVGMKFLFGTPLAKFKHLRKLVVFDCSIANFSCASYSQTITHLEVVDSSAAIDLSACCNLTSLGIKSLCPQPNSNLESNFITGIETLTLRKIKVDQSSLRHFVTCTQVEEIELYPNSDVSRMEFGALLDSVKILTISRHSNVFIMELLNMKHLEILNCSPECKIELKAGAMLHFSPETGYISAHPDAIVNRTAEFAALSIAEEFSRSIANRSNNRSFQLTIEFTKFVNL